jgi:hypothetical protein
MAKRKAEVVPVKSLARAVNAAVKLAAARRDVKVDKSTFLDRWEIVGRRLRDVKNMNVAFSFAEDVARRVKLPGVKLEPIAVVVRKNILVGFIERGQLPKSVG